jgi:transketolase C-terminal domain/subunit
LREHESVVVVEDHFPEQGLFGILCRLMMEAGVHARVHSLAPRAYNLTVGTTSGYYEAIYGIDVAGIAANLDALDSTRLARL